ncbi:hypothetical protein C5167_042043 [Papaver somniferum]|nr:hypothetical protein C5167_042043 [Papaver somniferum]
MAEIISVQNENKLEGKVIIITGGASGIGEATARLFAHHNPRMIVIADIQDKLGQDVVTSVGPISTAGIVNFNQQTIVDLDLSAYDRLMAINARGMLACVKHAARAMVDGGSKGSIVCTSIAASLPLGGYVDYGMSKHAVLGLMRTASVQLGKYGVRVNCVSPSALGTPMTCQAYGTDVEGVEKRFLSSCALGGDGLALKANHVANAVLFLASDDSAFITGHDLVVDGGYIPSSLIH